MIGIVLAVLITGIVLVTLILILNLTVAVGTVNGLIFYANIVGSTSRPLTLALPELVVAWLNLEPGFDGCFINGLDGYWKTWLKFTFPTYVFILVASVIIVSRFFPKFSRIIGKRNPVATLNTLILLSYSKLLHAVISIFLFTTLDCPGGSSRPIKVWGCGCYYRIPKSKAFCSLCCNNFCAFIRDCLYPSTFFLAVASSSSRQMVL